MLRATKRLVWLGSSRRDVRAFPPAARAAIGFQLWRAQLGYPPNDWKPMSAIGHGAREIRIHGNAEFRVIYSAGHADVYVLHAFQKHSRKTAHKDIEVARRRLEALPREADRGIDED